MTARFRVLRGWQVTGAWLLLLSLGLGSAAHAQSADSLASWADEPAKARLVTFVKAVTETGGPDYVPPAERIAVFDNDGTLWSEQPMYVQLAFALDRVKALAPTNRCWSCSPICGPIVAQFKSTPSEIGLKPAPMLDFSRNMDQLTGQ